MLFSIFMDYTYISMYISVGNLNLRFIQRIRLYVFRYILTPRQKHRSPAIIRGCSIRSASSFARRNNLSPRARAGVCVYIYAIHYIQLIYNIVERQLVRLIYRLSRSLSASSPIPNCRLPFLLALHAASAITYIYPERFIDLGTNMYVHLGSTCRYRTAAETSQPPDVLRRTPVPSNAEKRGGTVAICAHLSVPLLLPPRRND